MMVYLCPRCFMDFDEDRSCYRCHVRLIPISEWVLSVENRLRSLESPLSPDEDDD